MRINTIDFQQAKTLSIVQFQTEQVDSFQYVSLDYAIDNNMIKIKEISESGSVNTIFVLNKSDNYVFLMDGDVLIGAKQNRVLNTSVLLEPNSKTEIPVSCVEAGRWSYRSSRFRYSDFTIAPKIRYEKAKDVKESLEKNKGFMADQHKVWKEVFYSSRKMDVYSDTSDFSEIFEKRKIYFDDFLKSFRLNSDSNGVAIFIRKKLLSIDVFNRRDIYSKYFTKIIKGAAIEAYKLEDDVESLTPAEANYKVVDFFDKYDSIKKSTHKSIGVGIEKRFENKYITGFELEYLGNLIHLAAIQLEENLE